MNKSDCPGLDKCPYKLRCTLQNLPRTALITLMVLGMIAFCWWSQLEYQKRPPTIFEVAFACLTLIALAEDPIKFAQLGRVILANLLK